MASIKVLFASSGLRGVYGGSAFSEAILSSRLGSQGDDVTVICREDRLDPNFAHGFGLNHTHTYRQWAPVLAWVFKNHRLNALFAEADVFHLNGHWRWENYFLARLCLKHHLPYVLHPRGMLMVGHRKPWVKRLFNFLIGNFIVRHASKVIALSRFELRQFESYRIEDERLEIIPNGIIIPAKSTSAKTESDPYFLYLGRIESRKNLLFLVNAFYRYRKWGGDGSLVFVGPVEHGYDEEIKKCAIELNVANKISIRPPAFNEEKWRLVRSARAVIYPALDEAFGRVPFEALAAGTIPIVPDASGSAEYLKPFLPNSVYEANRVDSLSSAMEACTRSHSDGTLTSAQAWLKKTLDPEQIATKVHVLYQECLGDVTSHSAVG